MASPTQLKLTGSLTELATALSQGQTRLPRPLPDLRHGVIPHIARWTAWTVAGLIFGLLLTHGLSTILQATAVPFAVVLLNLITCLVYERRAARRARAAFQPTDSHDVLYQLLARLAPHAIGGAPSHLTFSEDSTSFQLNAALTHGELHTQVNTSTDGLVFTARLITTRPHPTHRPPTWGWQRTEWGRDVTPDGRTVVHAEGTWLGDLKTAGPALGDLLGALIDPPGHDEALPAGLKLHRTHSQTSATFGAHQDHDATLHVAPPRAVTEPCQTAEQRRQANLHRLAWLGSGLITVVALLGLTALFLLTQSQASPWLIGAMLAGTIAPLGRLAIQATPRAPDQLLTARQDTRQAPWLRWSHGRLTLGVTQGFPTQAVDLDDPFTVTLTRDPEQPTLGVAIHQRGSSQPRDRIQLRVPLQPTEATEALPQLQRDAPLMHPEDFEAWLWPLLTHRLELQGTPTPWRAVKAGHQNVAKEKEVVEVVQEVVGV